MKQATGKLVSTEVLPHIAPLAAMAMVATSALQMRKQRKQLQQEKSAQVEAISTAASRVLSSGVSIQGPEHRLPTHCGCFQDPTGPGAEVGVNTNPLLSPPLKGSPLRGTVRQNACVAAISGLSRPTEHPCLSQAAARLKKLPRGNLLAAPASKR